MKRYVIVLILIIAMCSACQSTPDKEIVGNKNKGKFEQALEAKPLQVSESEDLGEEYPERWETYYEKYGGKLKISIDADVVVSDSESYCVTTIKPYFVPIEQANNIVKAIFGTMDVCNGDVERTKTQIEESIIQVKTDIQDAKNSDDNEAINSLEDTLEGLYLLHETAPETAEAIKYNGEYTVYKEEGYEEHYILLRKNPFEIATPGLAIHNIIESPYGNGYNTIIAYENVFREIYNYVDENTYKIKFDKNPIFNTEEAKEAIEFAENFLDEIGINDRVLENMIARSSDANSNDISGYLMYFGKKYNDTIIPLFANLGGNSSQSADDYIYPFMPENLMVAVSKNEIVYFEWSNMYEVAASLNENIELRPFEEIMANVENQLSVKYAYLEDIELPYEVYVDEIILTYAVEPIKDKKYEYMLIPVWAFYGGYDYGHGYELVDGSIREGRYIEQVSLLTINAVDGTVISLN